MVSIKNFTVAIAGNPNSGKTTLFNQLTGLSQHVGNWPGVTVEKKYGYFTQNGVEICVVDLPGVYSLSPYTDEEKVTIRYLKDQRPDLIINVLDAVNIERNLYLTTQLCQLNIPMVVVLNMADMLEETGIKIDTVKLSEKLGSETYAVSASKGVGIADLKQGILHNLFYSKSHFDFDERLKKISTSRTVGDLKNIDNQSASNTRYKYISEICRAVIRKADETRAKPRFDLDRILTNKYLALPILAGIIILVFYIVFGSVGLILTESISRFFRHTIETCEIFFELHGVSGWISSLVCDGIITGMGTVLSFFPQIVLMFTFLAILEDSGYMSRIVFILDKPMRLIGLGGRSLIPILMGYGCTVPAALATRTLGTKREKLMTLAVLPFSSCSAKLPVYTFFVSVFFYRYKFALILFIYLFGAVVTVIASGLLNRFVFKKQYSSLIIELPEYRLPTLKGLYSSVSARAGDFVVRTGTVIMLGSIVVWILQSFDISLHVNTDNSQSIMAVIGRKIAPIFVPCGFGFWQASVGLLSGIIAKESIVSTLGIMCTTAGIQELFTPVSALAFVSFVCLYIPCVASIYTISRELKSVKTTALLLFFQLFVAWVMSFVVFRIGCLII